MGVWYYQVPHSPQLQIITEDYVTYKQSIARISMGQCCANDPKGDTLMEIGSIQSRVISNSHLDVLPIDSTPIPLTKFPPLQNQTVEAVNCQLGQIVYPDEYQNKPSYDTSSQVILEFRDGTIYQGTIRNKRREGKGRQIYADSSYYEGIFGMDLQEGYGRFIYCNGDCYEGEFRADKANGSGTYHTSDGDIYVGLWKNDYQEGEGHEKFKDGSEYQGGYKGGKKHGSGVFTWPDGCVYEGSLKNNYFHGKGIYVGNTQKYNGQWYNSLMHGYGVLELKDGRSRYIGQFCNGVKHGYGELEVQNGRVYKGSWENGGWVKGVCIGADGKSEVTNSLEMNF